MNKGELVNLVAKEHGLSKKETDAILSATLEIIKSTVAAGDKVTLVGFGSFELRQRQERVGRNPKTGEKLTIPAAKVPAFSAGKNFKEKVASIH